MIQLIKKLLEKDNLKKQNEINTLKTELNETKETLKNEEERTKVFENLARTNERKLFDKCDELIKIINSQKGHLTKDKVSKLVKEVLK